MSNVDGIHSRYGYKERGEKERGEGEKKEGERREREDVTSHPHILS